MITDVPSVTPVTTPVDETVATKVFELEYTLATATVGAATSGAATNANVEPMITFAVAGDNVSPLSAFGPARTVIVAVAVRLFVVKPAADPVAVTVMSAEPAVNPVTTPAADTVATVGALLT